MRGAARILVVEDHPSNMLLIDTVLRRAGYEVLKAETAAEAIALARSAAPILILMDVALPGMDGLEATRILKADAATRGIPIVALTAHAMKGDEQKALQAGCDGYLTKPINTRALTRTISRYIDRRDDS